MRLMVPIAMYGFLPVCIALFAFLPARRAAAIALIGGWLFLPQAVIDFPGLPDYSRAVAVSLGLLIGIIFFDAATALRLRPSWVDLPLVLWCLSPLFTSAANGLGLYDGLSGLYSETFDWAIPWIVGRLYFADAAGLRALTRAIFVGGLVYVPFCLYEVRMSPVLHHTLYGYNQHVFAQTLRLGGYRPMVFLEHGIELGVWMMAATLCGTVTWIQRRKERWVGIPLVGWLVLLWVTTILCRAVGAYLLLGIGTACLLVLAATGSALPLQLLAVAVAAYLVARIGWDWQAEALLDFFRSIGARAHSIEGRIAANSRIAERAMERFYFGWGGYNRFREGLGPTLPDSHWAITFGQRGLFGLVSNYALLLLAPLLAVRRVNLRDASGRLRYGLFGLALVTVLFTVDTLMNQMINPVYLTAAGALGGHLTGRCPGGGSAQRQDHPR